MGGRTKLWLGVLISLLASAWVMGQVDLAGLWGSLLRSNYLYLLPAALAIMVQYQLRALRWAFLLRPLARVPYSSRITSTVVGFAANLVLPARLGELVRAFDLAGRESLSRTTVLTTLALERVLDGLIVLPLFLGSALVLGVFNGPQGTADLARGAVWSLGLAYLVLLGAAVGLVSFPERAQTLLGWLLKRFPDKVGQRGLSLAGSVIRGLTTLKRPRLLLPSLAYTLLLWLVLALPLFLLARSVAHPVSFEAALFVNGLICLAVAVPAAPGYIGTFHSAVQIGFGLLLGMSHEKALALAIILHGATAVLTVLYGLSFVLRGRVSLLSVRRAASRAREDR